MKKVGICTINDNDNYGNRLQNYAVQEILKKNGVECYTIINSTQKIIKDKVTIRNFFPRCVRKIKYLINKVIDFDNYRKKCFFEFNKNINFYNNIINSEDIPKDLNQKFDFFFTGSDQVWNPNFPRISDIDFLAFASKNKRNSFSASFGVSDIPDDEKEYYRKKIIEFNNISVREDRGKDIIEELTGRNDVEVLVDPTMLLSCDEWDKVARKPQRLDSLKLDKYILNYFLGELPKEWNDEIERVAKENNCEIINILDKKRPFYQTGPSEFLYLEKNAFMVCTDSFHSSVFSIIYDTPFLVFDRQQKEIISMNSRIDTLVSKFKLENRRFTGIITNDLLICDYTKQKQILEKEKDKSIKFLKKALNIGENNIES